MQISEQPKLYSQTDSNESIGGLIYIKLTFAPDLSIKYLPCESRREFQIPTLLDASVLMLKTLIK